MIHIVWQALYMAMKYVPKDKQNEIETLICEGCKYDNDEEELACCWCQMGSMFEKKINDDVLEENIDYGQDNDSKCSTELKSKCSMNCERCVCRDCNKRFACDGGSPFFGCGE